MSDSQRGQILDGNACAAAVRAEVAEQLRVAGSPPVCLTTVLVGEDPPSQRYVKMKGRDATEIGMVSRHIDVPGDASQQQVADVVGALAADPSVHGILVQLPLPGSLDPDPIIDLIPPAKDVDGLTRQSLGALVRGENGLVPCTPLGVVRLLEHYGLSVAGKKAVVIGRSTLVGLPLSLLLARRGVDATVSIAHSRTADLVEVCRDADLVVGAVGSAHMITPAHVKPGAIVVDVGVSRVPTPDGQKLLGDVDFDAVRPLAGWITPNPGGTGPMTRAMLMANTLTAARLQGMC
jgi:methylenetetrahydrofolate dehydrogenase (NADP+) / methenyltetrahydrofolate cyclohydrolase